MAENNISTDNVSASPNDLVSRPLHVFVALPRYYL